MAIKEVTLSKIPTSSSVLRLVRGDQESTILRMHVDRYDGGVDLAEMTWMVNALNAAGKLDTFSVENVTVDDATVTVDWRIGGIATSAVGNTTFELEGVQLGDAVVWQSGTRVMRIYQDVDGMPDGVEAEQVSEVAQLIAQASQDLPELYAARDAATEAANAAREAAERVPADVGTVKSVNGAEPDESGNVEVSGLPEGAAAYQQLVTDGDGVAKWEDRPFGEKLDKTEILSTRTITSSGYTSGGSEFVEGKTYVVEWDGGDYECKATLYRTSIMYDTYTIIVGNAALTSNYKSGNLFVLNETDNTWSKAVDVDTREPFALTYNSKGGTYVSYSDETQHTIAIYQVSESIECLSDKFLPSIIPVIQSATVGQTIVVKAVDSTGKPTKWETADIPSETVLAQVKYENDVFSLVDATYESLLAAVRAGKDVRLYRTVDTTTTKYYNFTTDRSGLNSKPYLVFLRTFQTDLEDLVVFADNTVEVWACGFVSRARKINGYALSADITLTAADVGAVPAPEAAAVGQTIVVKAVDEAGKPTEWETAALPDLSGYVKTEDVPQAAAIADVAGDTPTAAEFNALLAALRAAGLMATE